MTSSRQGDTEVTEFKCACLVAIPDASSGTKVGHGLNGIKQRLEEKKIVIFCEVTTQMVFTQ